MRHQGHPGRADRPRQLTLPLAHEPGARLIVYAVPDRANPRHVGEGAPIPGQALTHPPSVAIAPGRQWPPRRSKVAAKAVTASALVLAAFFSVLALPRDWKDPARVHPVSVQAALSSASPLSREGLASGPGHIVALAPSPATRGPATRGGLTVSTTNTCLPPSGAGRDRQTANLSLPNGAIAPSAETLARHDLAWRRLAIARSVARPAANGLRLGQILRNSGDTKRVIVRSKKEQTPDLALHPAKTRRPDSESQQMIIDGMDLTLSTKVMRNFISNNRPAFNIGSKTNDDFLLVRNRSMNRVMAFMERPQRVLFATPCHLIAKQLLDSVAHAQEISGFDTLPEKTKGCLMFPNYGNFTRYRWPALLSNVSITK